jgi:SAM-dependent methyltransferase
MTVLKENVNEFNRDVAANEGYRYTTNAPYSAIVANRRLTEATLAHIPPATKSLIDIGCGDGYYTYEIKEKRPELHIEGTDPASSAIEHASSLYKNIPFSVSNILDETTLPGRKYDFGVVRGVLHHLTDPALAIRNSLKLADRILIIEPNGNNPILKVIEKTSEYHIKHEERSFTSSALSKFCKEAGARIEFLGYVGFVPFFFPTTLSKVIYFFQPFLEKVPVVRNYFSGQIIIVCSRKDK